MRVSPAGRAAIRQREGCRLSAYRDSRGIWTIGVGHVNMTPPAVHAGMRITEAEADAFLADDLAPVEATIAKHVRVPLTQNQCDALASLGFNIGDGGLARSTVVSRLNKGDHAGAADAFLLWAHPSSLLGRRREERAQFLRRDAAMPTMVAAAEPSPTAASSIAAPRERPAPRHADDHPSAAIRAEPPSPKPGLGDRLAFFFGRH